MPRPTTAEKGYGAQHQILRRQWATRVEAGQVDCWRCGGFIEPGTPWHLGHDDWDRSVYRGPEHATCNIRGANQKRTAKASQPRGQSRDWFSR